jgi:RNA polymerase sigma-70 factor (ECF subfamily)
VTGVADALASAHRTGWALVVASAMRASRDPWLAEECAQDAFLSAVISWQRDGVPPEPVYWLARAARNKVIDVQRREQRFRERMPLLVEREAEPPMEPEEEPSIPDDRLRLLFLCAHPSLAIEAQLVLMLRLVCGLSVQEISLVLLVPAPTVAARLTRAKHKITMAAIPFTLPEGDELTARVDGVLTALYLLFTRADDSRRSEDIRLAEKGAGLTVELLDTGLEARCEAEGLLALIRLTRARHGAKFENDSLVLLADQDRTRWDWPLIARGLRGATTALGARQPGKYALQAAIAAVHFQLTTTSTRTGRRSWPSTSASLHAGRHSSSTSIWRSRPPTWRARLMRSCASTCYPILLSWLSTPTSTRHGRTCSNGSMIRARPSPKSTGPWSSAALHTTRPTC